MDKDVQDILNKTYTLTDGKKRLKFRIPEITAAQVDTAADFQRLLLTKYAGKLGLFLQERFLDFAEVALVHKNYVGFWTPEEGKAVRKELENYISKYKGLPISFMQEVLVDFFAYNLRFLTGHLLFSGAMKEAMEKLQREIKSSAGGNISPKSQTVK